MKVMIQKKINAFAIQNVSGLLKARRYLNGMMIGMCFEYVYRVDSEYWYFPLTIGTMLCVSMIVDCFSNDHTSPDTYSGEDLHKIPFGLYEIFWKSGGSSLASVGNMHDGVRWIAPINWTSSDSPTGRMDKHADAIERMVLLYGG